MTDRVPPARPQPSLATRLSHAARAGARTQGFVNPPVHRGSTMLYPTCEARIRQSEEHRGRGPLYGTAGSPTHHALEDLVAEIEGGTRCQIVSTGLAAVTVPLLAYLSSGDHCLIPDSIYGPSRGFCDGVLRRMGVQITYYEPEIGPAPLPPTMPGRGCATRP